MDFIPTKLRIIKSKFSNISNFDTHVKLMIYFLLVLDVRAFALKCVCNPNECDIIRPEDCPGKGYIVWDPCRCCKVCARTFGEACGGPGGFSGTCEPPLSCVSKIPVGGSGICLDIPSHNETDVDHFKNCTETIVVDSGCEIVNRKCKCWKKMQLCKSRSITKWDFRNMQECQLNVANLVKSELEFDEDYTVPPRAVYDSAKCKDVACPRPEICPDDSSLKLVPKHHSHHYHQISSNAKDTIRRKRALVYGGRQRETIKIIPGAYDHHSRKRSITDDELLLLHCCPQYECVCKPNYCDQECPVNKIPANTTNPTEQFGVPGNCCVPCKESYCMHDGKFRKHGERWLADECTECLCEFGRARCLLAMCKMPNCLNYKEVPGECCPVCDDEESNFCRDVRYCNIICKYGYQRQGDCDLCQCARAPPNGSTVSYPEVKSTTATSINSMVNTEDIIRKGPHQSNSYGGIDYQFWISLLSCLVLLSLIIVFTVWYCHFRKSAKYITVQIA